MKMKMLPIFGRFAEVWALSGGTLDAQFLHFGL